MPAANGPEAMTTETTTPEYSHTQAGPLCLILYASALACVGLVYVTGGMPGALVPVAAGLAVAVLASAFHHLTVEDRGDRLAIRFGPLPLFRRTIRYADILSAEVGRTTLLDGWGIHRSLRGGWVWNIWGRDCVVIRSDKSVLRVGTDDAAELARFLGEKVKERYG
jgi:hypothetical protein